MYHQQGPFPHQANITSMADMVAQRLMENQAHHERAYADMYEQQFGPPPPLAPAPAPTPAPAPAPAPAPVLPPPILAPVRHGERCSTS